MQKKGEKKRKYLPVSIKIYSCIRFRKERGENGGNVRSKGGIVEIKRRKLCRKMDIGKWYGKWSQEERKMGCSKSQLS
jgi:hypothetical protein